jgi:protein-export SecD/SecF family membrane protein
MKAKKGIFFIVAAVILLMSYVAFFGVHIPLSDGKSFDINGAPDIRFGIDIRGGVDAVFEPKDTNKVPTAAELEAAKLTIENRLDKLNILDRDVTSDTQNGDVIVRFPWKSGESNFDPEKAIAELGETAKLTFVDPDGNIVLDGSHVTRSVPDYDRSSTTYSPIVSLSFDDEGKKLFADATTRLVNKQIKIYMDDVEISSPTVEEPILDGSAMINKIGTMEEAQTLANKIAAGSLPFSLTSRNHSIISPTLGFGALDVMVKAGITAFAVICLFLILYYRLPGFVACLALLMQVTGQLLALSIPQITLTLPGIAAVILSIGMGVDANVIVSERIREELRGGRPLQSAISAGFENSFLAVFDGNITVMIVAVIMMIFGSGALLSFAYSLLTGVILNFLAGVTASRLMIRSLSKFKPLRNPKFFMKKGVEA